MFPPEPKRSEWLDLLETLPIGRVTTIFFGGGGVICLDSMEVVRVCSLDDGSCSPIIMFVLASSVPIVRYSIRTEPPVGVREAQRTRLYILDVRVLFRLGSTRTFNETIKNLQFNPVKCNDIEIFQVNIGYQCNKMCSHCHIRAGPDRTESMNWETMQEILKHVNLLKPRLVDITGGAPELNPYLGDFIGELSRSGYPVQVRTNLTVLLEKENKGLVKVYRDYLVKIVASLPCYEEAEVDSVRGEGTFDESIKMLRRLNEIGYGENDLLQLDLVFNPEHALLPPNQEKLEDVFKTRLKEDYGIVFNRLITITNMPVGRFEDKLRKEGELGEYIKLLHDSYNPKTLDNLMCKTQISIDYDGTLFDCDFNLAKKIPLEDKPNINDQYIDLNDFKEREIITGSHCFGCSAGEGSSCRGALVT